MIEQQSSNLCDQSSFNCINYNDRNPHITAWWPVVSRIPLGSSIAAKSIVIVVEWEGMGEGLAGACAMSLMAST